MADQSLLEEAIAAVVHSPHAVSAWEEAESLAAELDRPDDIVGLINTTLEYSLEPEVAEMIGGRAVRFCDEWFGDEPKILEKMLARVLILAPTSEAALQRLSVIYTVAERWNDVMSLYDRAIGAQRDNASRVRLLREVSQLAKDVANRTEKAITYFSQLLELVPDDQRVSQSLERLLERHDRWADLIGLWEGRLEGQSKKEREKSRARIATCWLENLSDPQSALAATKPLLNEADDDTESCALLERIIEAPQATKSVRDAALDLLRSHFDASGRSREVIRILEKIIQIDPANSRGLREEAGHRLAELDDIPAAMDHYAALLAMEPESIVTEEKLRQLAERGGFHARHAEGLAAAARASASVDNRSIDPTRKVGLLAESARIRLERLTDTDGAIELLREAQAVEGASETEQLAVARRLAALYGETGRTKDRLAALERQARLEANDIARAATLSEAAKLAESLGETDRALSLWEQRVDSDPSDTSALDARIALLESQQRWDDLVGVLESRAAKAVSPIQRRTDLVSIARVHAEHRSDLDGAIAAWKRIAADHPDDEEAISSLADLLAETARWKEMADLLEGSASRGTRRTIDRLIRLGEALHGHLSDPQRALAAYRSAIAIDPTSQPARMGLAELLNEAHTRAAAADALAQAMRATNDAAGVLELLPARLAEAKDNATKLALLREAAQLRLDHNRDTAGALADLSRAFPLAPRDQLIELQLVSLAKSVGDYATLGIAYVGAIAALGDDKQEAARLRLAYADLAANQLNDPGQAARAYEQVIDVEPGNRRAVHAFVRLGCRLAMWGQVATAIVRYAQAREIFDDELLSMAEAQAHSQGANDELASELPRALQAHGSDIPDGIQATFQHRLAQIHRDRKDTVAAIAAVRRALELGGERLVWLADLVALERGHAAAQSGSGTIEGATPQLLDALRRLADADAKDLDALVGAAEIALKLGERDQALQALSAALGRATAAWRGTTSVRSARSVDSVAKWAIDGLVELHRTGGRARAAVDTLIEAARLPFDQATRREMRLRAAQLATVELGDNATAIDMLRGALVAQPNDLEVIERLAHLLELEDRVPELLTLRQIQLGLETEVDRKLDLRLELAKLVGVVEQRGGRLEALLANLQDRPGHAASINEVTQLLSSKGQHNQLADLLETQARRLDAEGDAAQAAKLWARFAAVAENDTKEIERAIAGHRRVVALSPTPESLRALARLNLDRGQSAQAVPWLESLLGTVPSNERLLVVLQLAKAHLAANQPDRAIAAIEVNLDERAPALELRRLLAEQYRKAELWEPLARHLTRSLPLIREEESVAREFAREAVQIYLTKLESPAAAIPALETALALDPTDKDLRAALAIGKRVAGELAESRALLVELINEFGRRRSPDRAVLHVELARVALAENNIDEAMAEMESASKMDATNASIQKELAEMAGKVGQVEKAERTYRALLLVVRRNPPGDDESAVGAAEVLYELHRIAAARDESEQASELLESAMESAVQSEASVRRLRRTLLAHNESERLIELLERRLATNPEPGSQARTLGDLAEALDQQLRRPEAALQALIKAMNAAPTRVELHERARDVAKRIGATAKFVSAVEAVVDRLRRKDDPPIIANLLMRAGDALEHDANDLRGAASLYRRVEMLGERLAEAFYAQSRVAAALGDTAEQARTLDKMFELAGTDSNPTPQQVDALYRLAEIFIANDNRRNHGLDLLERAFAAEPRWGQAGRLLKQATAAAPGDEKIFAMYERVARNGGDRELLLDFFERRANTTEATPTQIREAVDLAVELGHDDRAEALLVRAVAAARDTADGVGSAPWAVLAFAERRLAANDFAAARDLTYEIAPIAEPEQIDGLAMRIATRALTHRDIDLAAELYEFLRERNPSDRAVWQPLLTIYRELGDGDRLGSVVSSTLPALVTPAERNALRLEHATFLLDKLRRAHDALDVLRDALADDADNLEAAQLYEQTLRDLGDNDSIAEFLWSRFEDAQQRGHRESTIDVAIRLGDLLETTGSSDAARVYRAALVIAPDDREILRRVVGKLESHDNPRDAALLMERLLAVETAERAPELAAQLASMWEAAGDDKGVQRTLELAHKSAPDDAAIHSRLESWYRDHQQWAELTDLMTQDAERLPDDAAVPRLREAATVYTETLHQPLKAAEMLRRARARAPHVQELVTEHAAALAAGGELDAAQRAIGEALATAEETSRTPWLLARASYRHQLGDDSSAVEDLLEAYELDRESASSPLISGLERLRERAERDGDMPAERKATLQLARLLIAHGDLERGRAFLVGWIERDQNDTEPLYMLCDLDESIEHWDGVAAVATRLAYITAGDDQIAAAMRVSQSAQKAGRPAEAVPVLELVHSHQPSVESIRNTLRDMYEAAGEYRQLAGILVADADHSADPEARFANYRRAAELLLYQLEDPAAAQIPAQRALELHPDDHGALVLNVDVLIASGSLEAAGRTLEAAISAQKKRTPELAIAQQRMARVCAMMGDKDGQLAWLKKAFDVDRKNSEVAAELAQLATELGDYELALKPLRAITLMDNPAPVTRSMALLWEAKIENARGNRAKAELWAKKALREDPSFSDAQQFLEELS